LAGQADLARDLGASAVVLPSNPSPTGRLPGDRRPGSDAASPFQSGRPPFQDGRPPFQHGIPALQALCLGQFINDGPPQDCPDILAQGRDVEPRVLLHQLNTVYCRAAPQFGPGIAQRAKHGSPKRDNDQSADAERQQRRAGSWRLGSGGPRRRPPRTARLVQ
jgi:hypothetical protein